MPFLLTDKLNKLLVLISLSFFFGRKIKEVDKVHNQIFALENQNTGYLLYTIFRHHTKLCARIQCSIHIQCVVDALHIHTFNDYMCSHQHSHSFNLMFRFSICLIVSPVSPFLA